MGTEHEHRNPVVYDFDHPGGSAVFASAHDLIRFAMFHLKNHLPDQRPIISDESIDEMHRPTALENDGSGYGIGWATDYPYAGINLMTRVSELTKTPISRDEKANPSYWVVHLTDEALFRCPFTMATDVGTMVLSPQEVVQLRATGHPGPAGHLGGGGAGVPDLRQALGGRVEELRPGGRRPFRLGCHPLGCTEPTTNSQACLFGLLPQKGA